MPIRLLHNSEIEMPGHSQAALAAYPNYHVQEDI